MKLVSTEISSTCMDCLSAQVRHYVNFTEKLLIFWMAIINIDLNGASNANAYQKAYLGTEVNCTCSLCCCHKIPIGEELKLIRAL